MQSVGAGRASSSLLGPFGPHATSDLLERQISIRFPGQDEAYNTFYETTVGTGSGISDLRLRRQNTQTQALARQIACSFLLPTPSTSLEEEAENTEVEFRNGSYSIRRLVGRSNDHQEITDLSITINFDSVEIGTRRRPASIQVVETIHLSERFARIDVLLAHLGNVDLEFPEDFNLGEAIAEVRNPENLHLKTSMSNLNQLMTTVAEASDGQYDGQSDILPFLESLLPNGPDYEMIAAVAADDIEMKNLAIVPSELEQEDLTQEQTEVIRLVRSRRQQSRLRRLRLGSPNQVPHVDCVICGLTVPNDGAWVWCSHIVQWSDDEAARLDRANVAPMCRLGCDSAFETGLITVNNQGQTELNENHEHYDLLAPSLMHLNGCEVGDFKFAPHGTSRSEYYQRHRERHLN
jgi:hypothetical protein